MTAGFIASYATQVTLMVLTLVELTREYHLHHFS